MKYKLFAVIWVVFFALPLAAQTTKNQHLRRLEPTEEAQVFERLSSRLMPRDTATAGLPTAPGFIEVIHTSSGVDVNYYSNGSLQTDSTIAFQMVMPNGIANPLAAFTLQEASQVWQNFRTGPIPGIWQNGSTIFEAFYITPSGGVSEVLAYVDFYSSTDPGILQRADVSSDGTSVNLVGGFSPGTPVYASIEGNSLDVVYTPPTLPSPFLPSVGTGPTWTAYLPSFFVGSGQLPLVICSANICSTRFIYSSPLSKEN